MAIETSKHGFSPLKVGCPVCESNPFMPCKNDKGQLVVSIKPQFHVERTRLWEEATRPKSEPETAAEVVEAVPPTNPANEKPPTPAEKLESPGVLPTLEEYVKAGYKAENYQAFIESHLAQGWKLPTPPQNPTP